MPSRNVFDFSQVLASVKRFIHVESFIRGNHLTLVFYEISSIFHVCKLKNALNMLLIKKSVIIIRLFDNLLTWITFYQMIRSVSYLLVLERKLLHRVFVTWKVKVTSGVLSLGPWFVFYFLVWNNLRTLLLTWKFKVFYHVWVH